MVSRELLPPPEGETVSVSVKVPKDLAANTMRVMYRSEKCPITRSDGSGGRYKIDGAKMIEIEPQRQGMTDIYEAKLARDGGGLCEWKLSNVTFGVRYGNPEKFGEGAQAGGGGGVMVIFDDNQPQQRSLLTLPYEVNKDLMVSSGHYLWVSEAFLGGYEKLVRLVGEGDIFATYKAVNAKFICFEPILYVDSIVYSVEPKIKQPGRFTRFTYPDGSVVADGSSKPDFEKLEKIRLRR